MQSFYTPSPRQLLACFQALQIRVFWIFRWTELYSVYTCICVCIKSVFNQYTVCVTYTDFAYIKIAIFARSFFHWASCFWGSPVSQLCRSSVLLKLLCVCHTLCAHSLVQRHSRCSRFCALRNNAAMSNLVEGFVWTYVFISWVDPQEWNIWFYGKLSLIFLRNSQIFSNMAVPFYIPVNSVWKFQFLPWPHNHFFFFHFF